MATAQLVAAAKDIPLGAVITKADLTTITIAGTAPKGTILKMDDAVGRGVISEIFQGEPILESRLAGIGSGGGLAPTIPQGMRACAVRVDEVVGVAGFVIPLRHERARPLADEPKESTKRLSSESVYLEIAALRAFYKFAENEKLLPQNVAENLSLPRRWKRLPKALTNAEIEKLLDAGKAGNTGKVVRPGDFGTGLRLRPAAVRIEKSAAGATCISTPDSSTSSARATRSASCRSGAKAVEALNRYLETGRPKLVTPKSPANVFLTQDAARRSPR